ncbi:aminotransferase [uncultured Planktomarina sp.]|jgi:aspartate/methionine/tyrosine aminotransferase|uniref:aminotransferase n=1 Tax=uncultured Planktomarina sp. TaxID=1538529 RepID=UPI0032612CDF
MTSRTANTFTPPVMEAYGWLAGQDFSNLPLINVSQAAPVNPPPAPMVAHMAAVIQDDDTHLYGPVLGLPALRAEVAGQWSTAYGGAIAPAQVGITSGCNQAFCASIAMLCGEGDEVLLPTPFYFNHKMWLDMAGVAAVALPCNGDMIPDPEDAVARITPRTRAIVLVTPNNPCGVEYPADVIIAFYEIAKSHGLALIIDETYRDFHSQSGAPHALFQQTNWDQTLVQLYSFSKAYRLTGHRVGAVVASVARMAEIEKFLDTVSICANQLGQKAALWGMLNLGDWLAGERLEILARRQAIVDNFTQLKAKGWSLLGVGAYFAYLEHPFDMASNDVAQKLVEQVCVLALPGTMFVPETDESGKRQIRIAFANIDADGIVVLFDRLAHVTL